MLPSRREGISNTLLEAMASGVPVIATHVGGNPEILPEGIASDLVEPESEAIGAAILALVDQPDRRSACGEGGRARVLQNFSLDTMVKKYDQIYRSLL